MRLKRISSLLLCGLLAFATLIETPMTVMAADQGAMLEAIAPARTTNEIDATREMLAQGATKSVTARAAGDVAITATNFPDYMFAYYVYYYFDRNDDGILSNSERDRVTTMYPNDLSITSMVGVRHFPNLETLQCAGNELTSLDVSANKKLNELLCSDNKLKTLKVPSSLRRLYADNNQLSSISGLNNCKKMNQLSIVNNLFVKLPNMKKFSSLRGLSLEKNYLTKKELRNKLPKHALASNNKKWFNRQVKGQKKLAKPAGLKVANSGKKALKVSWNKRNDVTGYEVYVSTSKKGTYKRAKRTTGTSFTHKKLTKGRTYYYKIRSYRKIGGNTVYSAFTSVKSRKSK